jgi:hypothetical protein
MSDSYLDDHPTAKYFYLMRVAHTASQAVDMYDLRSDDPASAAGWRVLLEEQFYANQELIDHVVKYHAEILGALCSV